MLKYERVNEMYDVNYRVLFADLFVVFFSFEGFRIGVIETTEILFMVFEGCF